MFYCGFNCLRSHFLIKCFDIVNSLPSNTLPLLILLLHLLLWQLIIRLCCLLLYINHINFCLQSPHQSIQCLQLISSYFLNFFILLTFDQIQLFPRHWNLTLKLILNLHTLISLRHRLRLFFIR